MLMMQEFLMPDAVLRCTVARVSTMADGGYRLVLDVTDAPSAIVAWLDACGGAPVGQLVAVAAVREDE